VSGVYIRAYYGVPARRFGTVIVDGAPGVITGFTSQYLRVRFTGSEVSVPVHPTWRVVYELSLVNAQTGTR
jgi:hypothetical protein